MKKPLSKEEAIKKVINWVNNRYWDTRAWEKKVFETPGWANGDYDVEVWVKLGSPDKGIIIINNGYSNVRAIVCDKVYKCRWGVF